jgi:hypothetical protein
MIMSKLLSPRVVDDLAADHRHHRLEIYHPARWSPRQIFRADISCQAFVLTYWRNQSAQNVPSVRFGLIQLIFLFELSPFLFQNRIELEKN